ncbi:hypothetical protein LR48_Vigan11g144800 [Vigna angularis]|uniref:Uncharacterized protein n=1 Tax=Phaseolus angularis TaxID=3914 RepID=A0A0L9VUH0_PHAAN|nr:hypothetical protein LR48_Vigan11g144800 [Vigna angularis]
MEGNSLFILGVSEEVSGRESSFVKHSKEVVILCEDSKEVNHSFASRAPSPQSCNNPSRRSSKHLHSSPTKNPNSGAPSSNKGALGRGLPPLTRVHPSLHQTSRRAGPSPQSKASPSTPIATGAIAGRDVYFSLLVFFPRAKEKLSRSSANHRLREPSLREPQTRMVTADAVLNNRGYHPHFHEADSRQRPLFCVVNTCSMVFQKTRASMAFPKSPKPLRRRAFISQAPLQRCHPSSTPPSTCKILASRDILPRIIIVIQMRHHLQQTCKSKNIAETPFATCKRATLPFSRSWLMTA